MRAGRPGQGRMPSGVSGDLPKDVVGTYVPCLLGRPAETEACRVAASDEDQPLLCRGRADGGVDRQDLLPVLESKLVLDSGDGLGSCSFDGRRWHRWRRGDHRGDRGRRLVEEALHLIEKRNLLLGKRERRQGKNNRGRETHGGCRVWC
jgi:hypothetical protein